MQYLSDHSLLNSLYYVNTPKRRREGRIDFKFCKRRKKKFANNFFAARSTCFVFGWSTNSSFLLLLTFFPYKDLLLYNSNLKKKYWNCKKSRENATPNEVKFWRLVLIFFLHPTNFESFIFKANLSFKIQAPIGFFTWSIRLKIWLLLRQIPQFPYTIGLFIYVICEPMFWFLPLAQTEGSLYVLSSNKVPTVHLMPMTTRLSRL